MYFKLLTISYIQLSLKSFIFRIGLGFIIVSSFFIFKNTEHHHTIDNILLLLNSKQTKAMVLESEYNYYGSYTVSYIFEEDPNAYIYKTYFNYPISLGKPLNIKYSSWFPSINKSTTGYRTPSSIFSLTTISLYIGFFLILLNSRSILKLHAIIKNGSLTNAILIRQNHTEYAEYFETHFEYYDQNQQRHVLELESNELDKITDDEQELLIYQNNKPSNAFLVDLLPLKLNKHIKKHWEL